MNSNNKFRIHAYYYYNVTMSNLPNFQKKFLKKSGFRQPLSSSGVSKFDYNHAKNLSIARYAKYHWNARGFADSKFTWNKNVRSHVHRCCENVRNNWYCKLKFDKYTLDSSLLAYATSILQTEIQLSIFVLNTLYTTRTSILLLDT